MIWELEKVSRIARLRDDQKKHLCCKCVETLQSERYRMLEDFAVCQKTSQELVFRRGS